MAVTIPTSIQNDARLARMQPNVPSSLSAFWGAGAGSNLQSGTISNNLQLQNLPSTAQVLSQPQLNTNTPSLYKTISDSLANNLLQNANAAFFTNQSTAGTVANTNLSYTPIQATVLRPQDFPNLTPSQLASRQETLNLQTDQANMQQAKMINQYNSLRQTRLEQNLDTLATSQMAFSVLGGIDPLRSGRNAAALTGNNAGVNNDILKLFNQANEVQLQTYLEGSKNNLAVLQEATTAQQQQEQLDFNQGLQLSDRAGTFLDDKGNLQSIAGQTNVPTLSGREAARTDVRLGMQQQAQNSQLLGYATTPEGKPLYKRLDGLPTLDPAEARKGANGFPELYVDRNTELNRLQAEQGLNLNEIKLNNAQRTEDLNYALGQQQLLGNNLDYQVALQRLQDLIRDSANAASGNTTGGKTSGTTTGANGQTTPGTVPNAGVYIQPKVNAKGVVTGYDIADDFINTVKENGISMSNLEQDTAVLRQSGANTANPVVEALSKAVGGIGGEDLVNKLFFETTQPISATSGKGVLPGGSPDRPATSFVAFRTQEKGAANGFALFGITNPEAMVKDKNGQDVNIIDFLRTTPQNDPSIAQVLQQAVNDRKAVKSNPKFLVDLLNQSPADNGVKDFLFENVVLGKEVGQLDDDELMGVKSIFDNQNKLISTSEAQTKLDAYMEKLADKDKQSLQETFAALTDYKETVKSNYSGRTEDAKSWFVATTGALLGTLQAPQYELAETLWNFNPKL